VQSGGRPYAQHYQTKAVKDEERSIKMIIREQLPEGFTCHTGPVSLGNVIFSFPPIKSLRRSEEIVIEQGGSIPKMTKPDLTDNLMKGLCDAMQGIVYANDSQIYQVLMTQKVYSKRPGISLEIILH